MGWLALVSILGTPILTYGETPFRGGGSWSSVGQRSVWEQTAQGGDVARDGQDSDAPGARGGEGDDEDQNVPSRRVKVDGLNAIRLSREEQQQTGVLLQTLKKTSYLSESLAAGLVLDIQPLVDLRANYHAALGEQEVYRAAIAASGRSVERLRRLHREGGNISMRRLQESESQAASDTARLAAAERRVQDVRSQARLQWGETLADTVLAGDSRLFDELVSHREALLLITLRRGEELP
ncbi:MAG: hypothetical protein L0177_12720, partial [Chloroflexi bacterium]|nr:hypothetical protein [Chloroflexota bacterium]